MSEKLEGGFFLTDNCSSTMTEGRLALGGVRQHLASIFARFKHLYSP